MHVFLSYRRSDVGGYAGRLTDTLRQSIGAESVFQDVTAIALGEDFIAAIDRALQSCDAVLAVIGPGWLVASTSDGTPRLLKPDDYVRLELATALRRDIRVIPVLVGGAGLPSADALPEDLQGLVERQGIVLRDESWHQDVESLVGSLRGEPVVPPPHRRRWLLGVVVAVVLAASAVLAWRLSASGGRGPVADKTLRVVLFPSSSNLRVGQAISVRSEVYNSLGQQLGTGQCELKWSDTLSGWNATTGCDATVSEPAVSSPGVHFIVAEADETGGNFATGRRSVQVTVRR
jgi:hypothetical protein